MRAKQRHWLMMLILLLTVPTLRAADAEKQNPPTVISVGWSSPDTRYLRRHIDEWERIPFTGTLVTASWPQTEAGSVDLSSGTNSLSWSVFRGERFTPQMLEGPLNDLRDTKFTRDHDNFLWVVSYLGQGQFDWFDDDLWATVLHNIEGLSALAKEGGLKGLMLDCEEYGCPFWSYGGTRPDYALKNFDAYKDKSWEQTRDQVRDRGQSFIRAVNKRFPGCVIWLTYGYSHIVRNLPENMTDLSDVNNGLLAAFTDGMLEASDEQSIFIDGCEGSYRFSEVAEFVQLRKVVTDTALAYTLVPDIYKKKMRVGFGLYMDMYNYPDSHPWFSDRPNDNYMTPDLLQKALKNALEISDGYVWIYSEYPSWWLAHPDATFAEGAQGRADHRAISKEYWHALERATGPGLKDNADGTD